MSEALQKELDQERVQVKQLAESINMLNIEKQVLSQTIQEYLGANVRLRSQSILLENKINILNAQLEIEQEKAKGLSEEIEALKAKMNPENQEKKENQE